jgi:hypothetical protein
MIITTAQVAASPERVFRALTTNESAEIPNRMILQAGALPRSRRSEPGG